MILGIAAFALTPQCHLLIRDVANFAFKVYGWTRPINKSLTPPLKMTMLSVTIEAIYFKDDDIPDVTVVTAVYTGLHCKLFFLAISLILPIF